MFNDLKVIWVNIVWNILQKMSNIVISPDDAKEIYNMLLPDGRNPISLDQFESMICTDVSEYRDKVLVYLTRDEATSGSELIDKNYWKTLCENDAIIKYDRWGEVIDMDLSNAVRRVVKNPYTICRCRFADPDTFDNVEVLYDIDFVSDEDD